MIPPYNWCTCTNRLYILLIILFSPLLLLSITDGYVPADQFGSMPFNLALSLMYLAVALTWAILCFWYR